MRRIVRSVAKALGLKRSRPRLLVLERFPPYAFR